MVSWHGRIFRGVGRYWSNLRFFAFYNRTLFELFFIFLYAAEQAALVCYTFNPNNAEKLGYIVSVFAIIVLVTFALHKLLMESRIKVLEDEVKGLQLEKFSLEFITKDINQKYNDLHDEVVSQGLNISTAFLDKEVKK